MSERRPVRLVLPHTPGMPFPPSETLAVALAAACAAPIAPSTPRDDGIPRTDPPRYRRGRGLRKWRRQKSSASKKYQVWRRARMRMQRASRRRNRR